MTIRGVGKIVATYGKILTLPLLRAFAPEQEKCRADMGRLEGSA